MALTNKAVRALAQENNKVGPVCCNELQLDAILVPVLGQDRHCAERSHKMMELVKNGMDKICIADLISVDCLWVDCIWLDLDFL